MVGGAAVALLAVSALSWASGAAFKVTELVYLDVAIEREPLGRVVVGLFGELAPKTVENFRRLSNEGVDGRTYAGTDFHTVVKRLLILGGDVVHNNGSGSVSVYGGEFEDENLETRFEVSGLVAMANRGANTNGCQFFVTTVPAPALNGRHTVFGKVVEGQNFVHLIEHVSTDGEDRPTRRAHITASGSLPKPDPFYVSDRPYDVRAWLKASFVPLTMSFSILAVFHWMMRRLGA